MSPSMKQLKEELQEDMKVSPEVRDLHFRAKGQYCSDEEIAAWYATAVPRVSTGSKTDFYDIVGCKDVDDLAEHWGLKGDEFNCLKAIVGIALGARHSGTSPQRDANKLQHYANRIVARLNKEIH